MNKKQVILCCISVFAVIFFTNILINIFINQDSALSKDLRFKQKGAVSQKESAVSQQAKHKLVVSNPADYGIVITSRADEPKTQLQWDIFIDKIVTKSGVLEEKKVQPFFEESQITPDNYQQRIQGLDERINDYKATIENNPSDKITENHLQDLYALKAITKNLAKKLVSPNAVPAAPPQRPPVDSPQVSSETAVPTDSSQIAPAVTPQAAP